MTHEELIKNNRFLVFIGLKKLSFAKVSGLESEFSKEIYAEGGNSELHIMKVPGTSLKTIRFERGVQSKDIIIEMLKPGTYISGIQIIVLKENKKMYCEYYIDKAVVTKWEVSQMDAMDGNVLIETFEIEHTGIKKITL